MSKRKLTKQQQRRIQERQSALMGQEHAGLLVSHHGQHVVVEVNGESHRAGIRQNLPTLAAGDRVQVLMPEDTAEQPVVVACDPRENELARVDGYQRRKILAANIDWMWILFSPEPTCIMYYIDQYLAAAEYFGLKAAIVLNKMDVFDSDAHQDLAEALSLYERLGYPCYQIAAKQPDTVAAVKAACTDSSSVIVGQSGVGKSSLVNALFEQEMALEGDISASNLKGKHTTTTARLYHLPQGGQLIDSPGIRNFSLGELPVDEIAPCFVEMRPLIAQCQFRNCTHQANSKGCAIIAAHEAGEVSRQRLHHFWRMSTQD